MIIIITFDIISIIIFILLIITILKCRTMISPLKGSMGKRSESRTAVWDNSISHIPWRHNQNSIVTSYISPSGMNILIQDSASLVPDNNIHPWCEISLSHMDTHDGFY